MKKITIIFTLLLLAIRASDLDIPDGMFRFIASLQMAW